MRRKLDPQKQDVLVRYFKDNEIVNEAPCVQYVYMKGGALFIRMNDWWREVYFDDDLRCFICDLHETSIPFFRGGPVVLT